MCTDGCRRRICRICSIASASSSSSMTMTSGVVADMAARRAVKAMYARTEVVSSARREMTRLTSDRSPLTMAIVAAAARMRFMTGCRGVKLAAELAHQLNESSVWAQTVVCGCPFPVGGFLHQPPEGSVYDRAPPSELTRLPAGADGCTPVASVARVRPPDGLRQFGERTVNDQPRRHIWRADRLERILGPAERTIASLLTVSTSMGTHS